MIRGIRARLAAADNEDGVTLVELIVAMIITGFVLALTASFFIQTTKVTTSSVQTGNSSAVASNAIYEISNVVHQATTIPQSGKAPMTGVTTASTQKLVINSYVDVSTSTTPAPTQVTFTVDGSGNLIEARCVAAASGSFWIFTSCASTSSRTIGGAIVAPVSPQLPLFTYLDSHGVAIPTVLGSVPPLSIPSIASIQVSVNVLAAGSKTAPVYLTSNVGMPNIGLQIATP